MSKGGILLSAAKAGLHYIWYYTQASRLVVWFKERQFWQKYVHKGKKSFLCLATCHSKSAAAILSRALSDKKCQQFFLSQHELQKKLRFLQSSPQSGKGKIFVVQCVTSKAFIIFKLIHDLHLSKYHDLTIETLKDLGPYFFNCRIEVFCHWKMSIFC